MIGWVVVALVPVCDALLKFVLGRLALGAAILVVSVHLLAHVVLRAVTAAGQSTMTHAGGHGQ